MGEAVEKGGRTMNEEKIGEGKRRENHEMKRLGSLGLLVLWALVEISPGMLLADSGIYVFIKYLIKKITMISIKTTNKGYGNTLISLMCNIMLA